MPQVAATSTRVFRIDSQTEFSTGEVRSATVTSEGNVQVGEAYIRIPLGEAQAALSYAENADGDVFVGTSPGGEIYRVRGERAELFATVDALAVRALTLGPDGTLYAGTLPHGVVYAISPSGTVREFVNLENAEHVWSLAWSESLDRLFAATGPEGKLYAIDTAGRAEVYYDSDDPHILSLAQHPESRLFVGTDGDALLA